MAARESRPAAPHKDGDCVCSPETPSACACGCVTTIGYVRGGGRVCWGCHFGTRRAYLDYLKRWGAET